MSTEVISKDHKVTARMNGDVLECKLNGNEKLQLYKEMFGIEDEETFKLLLSQTANSSVLPDTDDKYNSVMPLLLDIAPKDALEGMLVE